MISVIVSSLSNCSSGPKPTISSMMSPSSLTRSWRPIGTLSAVSRSSTSSSMRCLSAAFVAALQQLRVELLHQVGQQLLLELHDKFLRRIGLGVLALLLGRLAVAAAGMKRRGRRVQRRQRRGGGPGLERRAAGECRRREGAAACLGELGPDCRRDAESHPARGPWDD